jgi:carbon storage regulator
MLVLSRHRDESIIIADDIVVTVVDIKGDQVQLGIAAPPEVSVHRQELYKSIITDNKTTMPVGTCAYWLELGAESGHSTYFLCSGKIHSWTESGHGWVCTVQGLQYIENPRLNVLPAADDWRPAEGRQDPHSVSAAGLCRDQDAALDALKRIIKRQGKK